MVDHLRHLHARKPGILRDGAKLRGVKKRRKPAADEMWPYLRARIHAFHPDSAGYLVGRAMLIKRCAGDAIRIALHDQRAVFEHWQDERRNPYVMAKEVAFRQLQLRPEQFAEVGDLQT